MELTLQGMTAAHVSGPVTIELPRYMVLLAPEELAEASIAENRAELVLAAGRHPSGNILFITGDGTIHEIDCEKQRLPLGSAYPVNYGLGIAIQRSMEPTFEMASDWAIHFSSALMSAGVVFTGPKGPRIEYVDE